MDLLTLIVWIVSPLASPSSGDRVPSCGFLEDGADTTYTRSEASVQPNSTGGSDAFLDALRADGPAAELGTVAEIYGRLTGSWDLEIVDYFPDGRRREGRGEVHFAWVLEGRAMQDVWIGPPRGQRDQPPVPGDRNRYGTTLRVYDPDLGAWRVTWINPVSRAEVRLIGRREGAAIVQVGETEDGSRIRCVFRDITPDTFTWYGERSADGGATWLLEVEFCARRQADVAPPAEPASREP
jgi:hypothetical protein